MYVIIVIFYLMCQKDVWLIGNDKKKSDWPQISFSSMERNKSTGFISINRRSKVLDDYAPWVWLIQQFMIFIINHKHLLNI